METRTITLDAEFTYHLHDGTYYRRERTTGEWDYYDDWLSSWYPVEAIADGHLCLKQLRLF